MRVFMTGATGFIGTAVIRELIDAGHSVLGLARNEAGAQKLEAAGVQVQRGDVQDLESLREGAKQADAVIHLAFIHDFSRFQEVSEIDRRAVETIGETLAGSNKVFVVTSGTGMSTSNGPVTEDAPRRSSKDFPRMASEEAAAAVTARGLRVVLVRLPQVHDTTKQGLITYWIQSAREKGTVAYVGDGTNRWAAAHVSDVARLYRLALEKGETGAKYHAVGEEGVPAREIAEVIAKGLNFPAIPITTEQAPSYLGALAHFSGLNFAASSAQTRAQLNWNPTGPSLLTDLKNMKY